MARGRPEAATLEVRRDLRGGALQTIPQDGSVVGRKVAVETLDGSHMGPRSIGALRLALNGITSDEVKNESLGGGSMMRRGIGGDRMALKTVGGEEVADLALGGGKMIDRGVGGGKLVLNTLGTDEVAFRGLAANRMALNDITSAEVRDLSLGGGSMADRGIGGTKLILNTITGSEVKDLSLGGGSFADRGISGGKMILGTITGAEVDALTLGGGKMIERGIGRTKIALNSLTLEEMSNGLNDAAATTPSFRSLAGTGTTLTAARSNHTHASVNWKRDYSDAQRRRALAWRRTVRGLDDGDLERVLPGLSALKHLALDAFRQLADDPHADFDETQAKLDADRGFRHRFRMENEPGYYARHTAARDEAYRRKILLEPELVRAAGL